MSRVDPFARVQKPGLFLKSRASYLPEISIASELSLNSAQYGLNSPGLGMG